MNSNLSVVNHSLTMSSREIAELCGKRHDNVMRDIRKMLSELYPDGVSSDQRKPIDVDEYHRSDRTQYKFLTEGTISAFMEFGKSNLPTVASFEASYTDPQNGQIYPEFRLPKRETLVLIAGYSVTLRARIIDRWQELEAQASPVPTSFAAALRLAAEQAERMEMLALERDHAVATKAHIGERREATAMNTASQAVKRANKLAVELDRSKQYATVKRMEMAYHGQQFNWRLLKSAATEMGVPAIDVFDANYGTVKAYHADVWREAYAIEIIDSVEVC